MSKHAINRYKADLRDFDFILFEQFHLEQLLGKPPFESWSADEIRSSLSEAYRFVTQVIGPLQSVGDEGCTFEDGNVKTPEGFKEAWAKLYDAGWMSFQISERWDGMGAPLTAYAALLEMFCGCNPAFSIYPGLAHGAGELIDRLGTDEQKNMYCPRLFNGQFGGTMCLTEAQAGSDVGMVRTRATRNDDGTYNITGSKAFISGGDHDLSGNIVHLVLARVEGAPAGTKGLTLFIVPKIRVNADGSLGEPNDVATAGIEHKMGINGSSTCTLNFGENDRCLGVPVGGDTQVNRGMAQMFRMMNEARISTGIQGLAVASTAYLNALDYAKERKQGSSIQNFKDPSAPRVAIIEHPDVRRMLLDMKARVEGIRALAVKLSYHTDMAVVLAGKDDDAAAYHQGQTDLLVPLVKAYGSDQAFRICETAIQVHGGVGYTKDYPVEQYCRDSKIFSIYEGTNHIQAMDLVGRKLMQAGGANTRNFLADVGKFVAEHAEHPTLAPEIKVLAEAQDAVMNVTMNQLMAWFSTGQMQLMPLAANRYLEMLAETTVGWLLLEGAIIATEKRATVPENEPDHAFYSGKIQAALYFARNVLPGVKFKAELIAREDTSPLDIPDAGFANAR